MLKTNYLSYPVRKTYFATRKYKEGKISIGKAAEIANLSISKMIDILAEFEIKSNLDVLDYLEGSKNI